MSGAATEAGLAHLVSAGPFVLAVGDGGEVVVGDHTGEIVRDPEVVREALARLAVRVVMDWASTRGPGDIRPMLDRVLVRPLDEAGEGRTAAGLVLPDDKPVPTKHVVVAVGPGPHRTKGGGRIPMEVREGCPIAPGDVVLTGAYVGELVSVGGHTHRLVRLGDILAHFGAADDVGY